MVVILWLGINSDSFSSYLNEFKQVSICNNREKLLGFNITIYLTLLVLHISMQYEQFRYTIILLI